MIAARQGCPPSTDHAVGFIAGPSSPAALREITKLGSRAVAAWADGPHSGIRLGGEMVSNASTLTLCLYTKGSLCFRSL